MICWKIRIFAYWTTPGWYRCRTYRSCDLLKNSYLCLLNNTSCRCWSWTCPVVICWKIRIFAYWTTPGQRRSPRCTQLWFAEKFVSLLIEQHHKVKKAGKLTSCDLLKNSYLCLLNNTPIRERTHLWLVVICWKIRIFAYWTTPSKANWLNWTELWFAEKFVSLLIEQHLGDAWDSALNSCDLLKNSYLCLLNNTAV